MDETAWLTATDPAPMMEWARDNVSERRRRLVMCAAARLMWDDMPLVGREAVEAGERLADGLLAEVDRQSLVSDLYRQLTEQMRAVLEREGPGWLHGRSPPVAIVALEAAKTTVTVPQLLARPTGVGWPWTSAAIGDRVPDLFREVVGNPFRPAPRRHEWWSSEPTKLAESIYAGRDYAALPVLADALEDAGCDDAALLGHLRGGGEHVRGCWALDAVLGRG